MAMLRLALKDERGGDATYPLTVKIRKLRRAKRAAKVFTFSRTDRGRSCVGWNLKPGRYRVTVKGPNYFDKDFECDVGERKKKIDIKLRSLWEIPPISKITGQRRKLLNRHLTAARSKWASLPEEAQTTFLAITHALAQIGTGKQETALDHIEKIDRIIGDPSPKKGNASVFRLFVTFNSKFSSWIKRGTRYAHGKKKNRKTVWATGHTKNRPKQFKFPKSRKTKGKVPNLQWTYKKDHGSGELDLDGRRWLLHLTRGNSDARAWYRRYVRKFGSSGFARRNH